MPQTLASDIAHRTFAAVLARIEGHQDRSAEEGRGLLAGCDVSAIILQRIWDHSQELFDRGMEVAPMTVFIREFMDVLALAITAYDAVGEKVKAADLPPEELQKGLSMLEGAARRAVEMKDELSALLEWLETPLPDIDPAALPPETTAPDTPGYISLDALKDRLLSGRDA